MTLGQVSTAPAKPIARARGTFQQVCTYVHAVAFRIGHCFMVRCSIVRLDADFTAASERYKRNHPDRFQRRVRRGIPPEFRRGTSELGGQGCDLRSPPGTLEGRLDWPCGFEVQRS